MAIRVGINGFGRIGRLVFRILTARAKEFEVVGRKVERSGKRKFAGSGIIFWTEPQAVTPDARATIVAPRANIRRPPIHCAITPIRSLRHRDSAAPPQYSVSAIRTILASVGRVPFNPPLLARWRVKVNPPYAPAVTPILRHHNDAPSPSFPPMQAGRVSILPVRACGGG